MHNIENVKKKHLNILKDDFWEYDRVVSSSKRVSPRFGVQRLEYSNRRKRSRKDVGLQVIGKI